MRTGRQPVDQLAAQRKPTGQDAIWGAIRVLSPAGEHFTRQDITAHLSQQKGRTAASRDTIRDYVARLMAAAIVRQVGGGTQEPRRGYVPAIYSLVNDTGPETPRVRPDGSVVLQGAGREAIWRTIRILGEFSISDLVKIGSTEEVAIGDADARFYVKWLHKAGYLHMLERGNRHAVTRYRLLPSRNTGPMAPQLQRSHQVFDRNLRKVTWAGEPEVVE